MSVAFSHAQQTNGFGRSRRQFRAHRALSKEEVARPCTGVTPNPSIERTPYGAAHVER
jgi:hypothetical protein